MYDTNGDGHIDFREFMIVLYVMSNGTPEENLKQVTKMKKKDVPEGANLWLVGQENYGLPSNFEIDSKFFFYTLFLFFWRIFLRLL